VFDAVHDMKRKFERKKKGARKGFAFQSKRQE